MPYRFLQEIPTTTTTIASGEALGGTFSVSVAETNTTFLWYTASGLEKCLVSGVVGTVLFSALGWSCCAAAICNGGAPCFPPSASSSPCSLSPAASSWQWAPVLAEGLRGIATRKRPLYLTFSIYAVAFVLYLVTQ